MVLRSKTQKNLFKRREGEDKQQKGDQKLPRLDHMAKGCQAPSTPRVPVTPRAQTPEWQCHRPPYLQPLQQPLQEPLLGSLCAHLRPELCHVFHNSWKRDTSHWGGHLCFHLRQACFPRQAFYSSSHLPAFLPARCGVTFTLTRELLWLFFFKLCYK